MTFASRMLHQLTDMIHSAARHYRDESLKHRKFIVASVLRNVKKHGRFIRLNKNSWQVISDEEALRRIDDRFRYTYRQNTSNTRKLVVVGKMTCGSTKRARIKKQRIETQTVSQRQCITVDNGRVNSAPSLYKRLKVNYVSLREILLEAKHAIETAPTDKNQSNHGFMSESSLCEYPRRISDLDCASVVRHCTAHTRQQYNKNLCARHFHDDIEDDPKLAENDGLNQDHSSEMDGYTSDASQQNISHSNYVEKNEKAVEFKSNESSNTHLKPSPMIESNLKSDVDYLSMPIDVDESILNFLGPMDNESSICYRKFDDEVKDESRFQYMQRLSESINLAIYSMNDTTTDSSGFPNTSPDIIHRARK